MASYRTPLGTVVRFYPDWNVSKLAAQNVQSTALAAGASVQMGVFNNSAGGEYLVLWDLTLACIQRVAPPPFFQNAIFGGMNGDGVGHSPGPGTMLDPMAALVSGLVWVDTSANHYPDFSRVFPLSGGGYSWPHEWPLALVPPGQSFAISFSGPCDLPTAGFVWEQVKQI